MSPSYSKKSKSSKKPEDLSTLINIGHWTGERYDQTKSLVENHILKANTLDEQIIGLRNLIMLIYSSQNETDNAIVDKNTIEGLIELMINLFFRLKSNTCLKSVIANAISKETKTEDCIDDIFMLSFSEYLRNLIRNVQYSENDDHGVSKLKSDAFEELISCVMKSLENNCQASILATKNNSAEIVTLIENICLIPISEQWENKIKAVQTNDDIIEITTISKIIRLTLSLQSLSRQSLSSTFLDTLVKFRKFYFFGMSGDYRFDTETESNLSLLLVNEAKNQHVNNFIEFILELTEDDLQLRNSVMDERSVTFVVQTINALAISSDYKDLFELPEDKSSDSLQTRFEKIYSMLQHWSSDELDPQLCIAHVSATYNLVIRLQKFLKLRHDKSNLCHLEASVSKTTGIDNIEMMLQKLEIYVLNMLCHNTDKVKHIARNILNALVIIYRDYLPTKEKMHQLIRKCMDIPWEQKIKYLALLSIFKYSSSQSSACVEAANDISRLYPDMPTILVHQLHLVHPSLESHFAELYEVLVTNDHMKLSHPNTSNQSENKNEGSDNYEENVWFDKWYVPLLNLKASELGKISIPALQKLIYAGMKLSNVVLNRLIKQYQKCSQSNNVKASGIFLQLVIIALKKQKLDDNINLFKEADPAIKLIITNACFHFNEDIRIKALELLVCSKSSKQAFQKDEIELLMNAISVNMVPDSRSTRQDFIHCLKKMFDRMKEGLNTFKKVEINQSSFIVDLSTLYDDFLSRLGKYLFSCLFKGATSTRRGISLEIFNMIIITFIENNCTTNMTDLSTLKKQIYTKASVDVLFECLEDPYEQNKEFALNCLNRYPKNILSSYDKNHIKTYVQSKWEQVTVLRCSHKPPETVTAAYILRYLIENFSIDLSEELCSFGKSRPDSSEVSSENVKENTLIRLYHLLLDHLLLSLKKQINTAELNLIKASEEGPMYGTLYCIRTILEFFLNSSLSKHQAKEIKVWILQLIEILSNLSVIVAKVVNNDSPEGHLPMDFTTASLNDNEALNYSSASSQKLLLCAWRTSKEVSLLFGNIAMYNNKLNEVDFDNQTLKKVQGVLGNYFSNHLSEVKHRGAFEQAYVGFCNFCKSLWKNVYASNIIVYEPENNERSHNFINPAELLQNIIQNLKLNGDTWIDKEATLDRKSKQSIKPKELCITRRSAGVPYLIQGIITTNPNHKLLEYVFNELFKLVKSCTPTGPSPNHAKISNENNAVESTIHACNILRVIYRDSSLGDDVLPFVAEGVILAINGFKARLWPVRNSATLLFSALMTRIFGVKKSKTELSKKNLMTSRSFFIRFPPLYTFLLEEVTNAANQIQSSKLLNNPQVIPSINPAMENSLFPILLILAKLQPPPSSESDTYHQISAFLPPLLICCGSAIYKVRELASKAYVTLSTPEQGIETSFTNCVQRAYSLLEKSMCYVSDEMEITQHNLFHGYLFMALNMLHKCKDIEVKAKSNCDEYSLEIYEKTIKLSCDILNLKSSNKTLEPSQQIGCLITKRTVLQIVNELLTLYVHYKRECKKLDIFEMIHGTLHELSQSNTCSQEIWFSNAIRIPGYTTFKELLIRMYLYVNEYIQKNSTSDTYSTTFTTIFELRIKNDQAVSNNFISVLLNQLCHMKNYKGK